MTAHELKESESDLEVSLLDIFDFIREAWKTVSIMGLLGIVVAITYLWVTPSQYEAIAQIRMAQLSIFNPANPFGATIEDPNSLMARMKFSTNYDEEIILACNGQGNYYSVETLVKSIKFTIPKGSVGVLELNVSAPSMQQAKDCASAIYRRIRYLQLELAEPLINEAKIKLEQDSERIEALQRLIMKADKAGGAVSAVYLSTRDEQSYFLADREKRIDLINSAEQRGASLVSPIYASEVPVSPKKTFSIVVGLAAGIFLGLLLVLISRTLSRLRLVMKKATLR